MRSDMAPTLKLYDQDAYATEFEARIIETEPYKDGTKVILDRTLFFPEEGGQYADEGILCIRGKSYPVADVTLEKRECGEVICHYVENHFQTGDKVFGKIDFAKRYDKMQNHTGEHILSGIIHKEYGFENVGFHLNSEVFTMDFNGILEERELEKLEMRANRVVWENVPVYGKYLAEEDPPDLDYRSKKEIQGAIRIVTIEGYDRCACCAPHVKSTREVGLIKIIKAENWKKGMRLTVLCGERAYSDYRKKHEILQKLARSYSVSEENILQVICGQREKMAELEYKINEADFRYAKEKLLENPIQFFDSLSGKSLVKAMDEVMKQEPDILFLAFVGSDGDGYRYAAGSYNLDVKALTEKMCEKLGAKGGGKNPLIQGIVHCTKEQICKVLL